AKKLARELKSERSFVWLGRRLPESRADAILKKGGRGIYAVQEAQRFYPDRRDTAHVVGFLEENNGLAGLEFYYDHLLRRGSGGMAAENENMEGHLQLTLDLRVQKLLSGELGRLLQKTEAPSGSGIMINIKTGAILAMVSLPDYDPNYYWDSSSIDRLNRAVAGSVDVSGFQSLFGFAASYEGVVAGEQGELAALKMALRREHQPKPRRGAKWFRQNGANLLSPELQVWSEEAGNEQTSMGASFGLFRNTGIDLPETLSSLPEQSGQTSPLKLLTAFAGLVNGGIGITPHLGEAIIDPCSGRRVIIDRPQKLGLVKPLTSKKIVELLADASRSGSEVLFLESMRQIVAVTEDLGGEVQAADGRQDRYQTVMIGLAPRQEPEFALMIALDRAVVASNEKTPMRSMGEAVIGRMMSLADEKIELLSPEIMAASEKLIYTEWLSSKIFEKKDLAAVSSSTGQRVMPDLVGMSLRKALRNLQQLGLKVEIVGSGRVAAQKPESGMNICGDECLLTLLADEIG
ncbi:MAG: PASTA domain-containing protein, partial [Desulfobulbaceae bacterium]|nr:PASTA domain-containing protein [Desulfobulbaceae bacterium]